MFAAYLVVTAVAIALNGYVAVADFTRANWVVANVDNVNLPAWTLMPLGVLKALGAGGLLVGMAVPVLGVAAAVGLVAFFVGAVITHARAGVGGYQYPGVPLLLALASLVLRLATL